MDAREEQQTKNVSRMINWLNIFLLAICSKTCVVWKFVQKINSNVNNYHKGGNQAVSDCIMSVG